MSCIKIHINLLNHKQIKLGVFKKACTQHYLINKK